MSQTSPVSETAPDILEQLRRQSADASDWNGEVMKNWDKIRGAEHHEYCAVCIEEIAKKIADEQNLDTTKPMSITWPPA